MNLDQAIDNCISKAVENKIIPGAVVAVVNQDGLMSLRSHGVRSEANQDPMTGDTVFQIASMTKPITGTACMQAVERGLLALDQPAAEIIPWLGEVQVLEGFAQTEPILRPPSQPITLRNLLTHTSGFTYEVRNSELATWKDCTGNPGTGSGKLDSLRQPLSFDPGTRWEYGIGIDWAGQLLEVVSDLSLAEWMHEEIFDPLAMTSTAYDCRPDMQDRRAATHVLNGDTWKALVSSGEKRTVEFDSGGGGLFSTVTDYAKFMQMLLRGGELAGRRLLSPQTVSLMSTNSMGDLRVSPVVSQNQKVSSDFEFMPGTPKSWGLTFQINEENVQGGRQAGSLSWAGLCNTHFWVDPKAGLGALLMTQTLPFMIPRVATLLKQLERAIYETVTSSGD